MATSPTKASSAKQASARTASKASRTGGVDLVIKAGDTYTLVEMKTPKVVKRGDSYLVGGTEARKLVGTTPSRTVQSSPKKGKLSARDISSLVKRMKVAA